MAVNNLAFTKVVDDWVSATEQRMTAVFRQSSQRVINAALDGVPIDLGFAHNSGVASLESMPPIDPSATNKEKAVVPFTSFGEITAVISGAQLGQTIYFGFTAAYILPLEYGHSKQAPAGFVRLAAEQWPAIVADVTAEAKSRAG